MDKPRTHDRINRRLRHRRTPTGKQIALQPRDLLWFEKLHRHGPLSSTYLHAFSENLCRNPQRARNRLTDLYNENSNPHGGFYMDRPPQQFQTLDARYQDLVYDITPCAEEALKEDGRFRKDAPKPTGPWVHRYMVSSIAAAIEIETLKDPSLRFVFQDEILERAEVPLRFPVEYRNRATKKLDKAELVPDGIFGLEYRLSDGRKRYRFFAIEADRNTEPIRSSQFARKSYYRAVLQYREFVGRGVYKDILKMTVPLLVLNVTTNPTHLQSLVDLVAEVSGGAGNTFMLFQATPSFGRVFKPPALLPHLLHGSWQRAGHGDFHINEC